MDGTIESQYPVKHIKFHYPSFPIVPWTVPWIPSTSQAYNDTKSYHASCHEQDGYNHVYISNKMLIIETVLCILICVNVTGPEKTSLIYIKYTYSYCGAYLSFYT